MVGNMRQPATLTADKDRFINGGVSNNPKYQQPAGVDRTNNGIDTTTSTSTVNTNAVNTSIVNTSTVNNVEAVSTKRNEANGNPNVGDTTATDFHEWYGGASKPVKTRAGAEWREQRHGTPALCKPIARRRGRVHIPQSSTGAPTTTSQRQKSHPLPLNYTGSAGVDRSESRRSHMQQYPDIGPRNKGGFPRLSKPLEVMRGSYDVVVIGSGYGGGVAASRMARTRKSVCVLERGKERWPGEYPVSTSEALGQLHTSGYFSIKPNWVHAMGVNSGDPTGMFHLFMGVGQHALVGNGLGGTSLINANVFLRADAASLGSEMWPEEIRNNPEELDPYYKMAEEVLEPQEYPDDWPQLPKLGLLQTQAAKLGKKKYFEKVPQTTRFRNGFNSVGVEMQASTRTGQDCTGINDGSKNTTLVTYIADAWNWGAEIFCSCEVRYIEKASENMGGGWIVYFAWHGGLLLDHMQDALMWVHAKEAVFLGAGALGTTEILLRSKEMGLPLSDRVGKEMSGNGDVLAFGYNTNHYTHSIGDPDTATHNPVGPCITSMINLRGEDDNPLDGYVIQEGTIPRALAPLVQAMLSRMPGSVKPDNEGIILRIKESLQKWSSMLFGYSFSLGAMEKTQVFLAMAHDDNQAIMSLKDETPLLQFSGVGRGLHVKRVKRVLEDMTKSVGGTLVHNPFYALFGEQEITAHPIGGAAMAYDGTGITGVTNHAGQVFSGSGTEVHPGLVVVDGALVPSALGVNPLATITALAERVVAKYCERHKLHSSTLRNRHLNLFSHPQHLPNFASSDKKENKEIQRVVSIINNANSKKVAGIGFSEVMKGYLRRGNNEFEPDLPSVYQVAYRIGRSQCSAARLCLNTRAWDLHSLVNDDEHEAIVTGTFVCPVLEGSPFMIQRGCFNLFLVDNKAPGTRNLTYDFDMTGINGRRVHFHGYKVVDSSVAFRPLELWKANTTMYVTITSTDPYEAVSGMKSAFDVRELDMISKMSVSPMTPESSIAQGEKWRHQPVLARGMMNITLKDFASELLTVRPTGQNTLACIQSALRFFTYFGRESLSLFLAPFSKLDYSPPNMEGRMNGTPETRVYLIVSEDAVKTQLYMWQPTYVPKGQEVKNLLLVPGASVDQQIFATPTIPYNAINYLRRAGYRCFVSVYRICNIASAETLGHTTFESRLDICACIKYIRDHDFAPDGEVTRKPDGVDHEKVYVVAHCMGAVSLSAGLLDGTIPAQWIAGITCSQVFCDPIWNRSGLLKIAMGKLLNAPLDLAYRTIAGPWFQFKTSPRDKLLQRVINQLLRFMPTPRGEICDNAACHRCTMVFGRLWNHKNLNEATHRRIDRFFGGIHMDNLGLLMQQGDNGHVLDNNVQPRPLNTDENLQLLRGIPIMLFVGSENAVLNPDSTDVTYNRLCEAFGRSQNGQIMYRRRVIPGYGHLDCWMGRNAWKDVFPIVGAEVDRVVRGEHYRFVEPNDEFKIIADCNSGVCPCFGKHACWVT